MMRRCRLQPTQTHLPSYKKMMDASYNFGFPLGRGIVANDVCDRRGSEAVKLNVIVPQEGCQATDGISLSHHVLDILR